MLGTDQSNQRGIDVQDDNKGPALAVEPRQAVVLSADLLGFSNEVSDVAEGDGATLLLDRLDRFARQFSGVDFEDEQSHAFLAKKYWAFSDGIVVCWYDDSEAQATMTDFDADLDQLSGIAAAQARIMIAHRQLVRGGVGAGWIVERDTTVTGTALVNAARIEKKIEMPFIGVEQNLYDYYKNHPGRGFYSEDMDPVRELFIPPSDYTRDYPALDYLMIGLGEIDLTYTQMRQSRSIGSTEMQQTFRNECWSKNRLSFIEQHRSLVIEGLQHPDKKVQVKYEALRQHHNLRVSQLYAEPMGLLA